MGFLKLLAQYRTPFLDNLFSLITHLGDESVVIVIICVLYWCINKKTAYKVGITFFISGLLNQGLKITFRTDRPWVLDPEFKPVESAIPGAWGYSFPSGHTQSSTALFGSLGLSLKNIWIKTAFFAAAITVAFSRMYLGVHTPADVLAAFGATALIAILVQVADSKSAINQTGKTLIIIMSAMMLLTSIAMIIYAVMYEYQTVGNIDSRYIADCCKAAGAGMGYAVGYFIEHLFINFDEKTDKFYHQIIKLAVGLAVALLLKSGIKSLFGEGFFVSTVRYFILVLWVIALWPMIFKRLIPLKKPHN